MYKVVYATATGARQQLLKMQLIIQTWIFFLRGLFVFPAQAHLWTIYNTVLANIDTLIVTKELIRLV